MKENRAMFDLKGKVVLVAGGAGYLGHAICKGLLAQGATVMVADQAQDRADALAAELNADGGKGHAVALDVAEEASCQAAVAHTVSVCGRLDVLVNATCFAIGKKVDDLRPEEFDRANRVNITGTFMLAREAAKVMSPGASIVLFASMYGLVSPDPRLYEAPMNPNPIEYGAGKAAIVQMTKYLAVAWGPRGIRVNAIAPGPFPNPNIRANDAEFVKRLSARVPMGRVGRQAEVAGTVAFLASEASSYMNGVTLPVDGGWTAW